MGSTAILRSIGALNGTGAGLVVSGTVNVVFGLDDVLALRQTVEEEVRGVVAWRTVVAALPVIATQLLHGFQAGSPLVLHLHKVEVALALDGQTDGDADTYLKR